MTNMTNIKIIDEFEQLVESAANYKAQNIFDGEIVIGYMCMTDFECELGGACGGNTVYPSISDLLANRKCVTGCGIVEVEIKAKKTILAPSRYEDGYFNRDDTQKKEVVEKTAVDIIKRENYLIKIEQELMEKESNNV